MTTSSSLQTEIGAQVAEVQTMKRSIGWRLAAPARYIAKKYRRVAARLSKSQRKRAKSLRSDVKLLGDSDLFDREWYLERYPDVRAAGLDPILHYLLHGAGEGRDPSERFETDWYLSRNADVAATNLNPLVHFIRFGENEGRFPTAAGADAIWPIPRLAVLLHVDHVSGIPTFKSFLMKIPFPFALFVSTDTEEKSSRIQQEFECLEFAGLLKSESCPGYCDIAAKLIGFRDVYDSYAYVLHLRIEI